MRGMVRVRVLVAVAVMLWAGVSTAESPRGLTRRIWLLEGAPPERVLDSLRAGGFDGFVLPVGQVELRDRSSTFALARLPDLASLVGWPLTPLVWVSGSGTASGDPDAFATQFTPVQQGIRGSAGLLLASRSFFPGLAGFAAGVAARLGRPVELALPAQELAQQMPVGGWPRVRPVAISFGNPSALGFPASTLQDDLAALDVLDSKHVPYRAAIVVEPRVEPPPGPAGASLAVLSSTEAATYTPGVRGDAFRLRRSLDWGGTPLPAGQSITVEAVDTVAFHRDLGLLLRSVRLGLEGWDAAGLPRSEPTVGMSREAFLDYLAGGLPYPRPRVEVEWPRASTAHVRLDNPTAQASALATAGNWVELRFTGTELRDVQLDEFSGVEYGKVDANAAWHLTAAREATAVRLYLTLVAPRARVGGFVTFLTQPRDVSARWNLRLGDGSDLAGPLEPAAAVKR